MTTIEGKFDFTILGKKAANLYKRAKERHGMEGKTGQMDPSAFLGLAFLLIGFFAAFIIFMGFLLKNADILFIGSIITGLISLLIAVIERVMFK